MSVRQLKFIVFLGIATILFSCKDGTLMGSNADNQSISQGVINYEISYPKPFKDKWMEKMMPRDMDMYFKNNKVNGSLSFGLGMIKIGYVTDNNNKELYELLKVVNKKLYSQRNVQGAKEMIEKLPQHKITLLPDTKTVAGFLCKRASIEVVKKNPEDSYKYDAWYTDKIDIKDANWCTPFNSIKGVLMEYQIERMDVVMRFKAQRVAYEEIKDDEFTVPKKYQKIPVNKMESQLEQLKEI